MTTSLLLVEDDPVEARRLALALAQGGYAVTSVADGDAALAALAAERFDVMLLDMVVPGLDGMGVLGEMARRGLSVPVVVQVTPSGMDAAAGAIRAGARDFVVKPAGALRLEVALANAMALARAASAPASAQAAVSAAFPTQAAVSAALPAQAGNVVRLALPAARAVPDAAYARLDEAGHTRTLEEIEAEAIRFACSLYGGRLTEAARRLGIGRSTLYRKLAAHPGLVALNLPMEPEAPQLVAAE